MTAEALSFREALTDAMRYWEPRRILYNAVLLAVVGVRAFISWHRGYFNITTDTVLGLFVLWVLANVAYCAAYLVDVPIQLSGFRSLWIRVRVVVYVIGVAFGAVLAYYFSYGMFEAVI